jgi:hypothetical protein
MKLARAPTASRAMALPVRRMLQSADAVTLSNETFVPASEPRISIYGGCNVVLAPLTGAGCIS